MSQARRTIGPLFLFAAMLSIGVVGVGCHNDPPPPPAEPIPAPPPPPPTPPTRVPSALIDKVVNDAAQELAHVLADVPEIRAATKKQVLALAPLKPDGRVSDDRFASAVQSLHGRLQSTGDLNKNFVFVNTSVDDARDLLGREADPIGSNDALDAGRQQNGSPARYAPNSIYVLTGRYSQSGRSSDGNVRYRLQVEVQHPADRRLITSKEFHSSLAWNAEQREWVVAED